MSSQLVANDQYWSEYNNLQHIKHKILRRYLGAWYAILARGGFPKLVYIETHAGRGRHLGGQEGSPLVAMTTLLGHAARPAILESSECVFRFVERDAESALALRKEIESLGQLPKQINWKVLEKDYSEFMKQVLTHLDQRKRKRYASFVFVDPFGYSLDTSQLARVLELTDGEMFINFMWRWVDMAIVDDTKSALLDQVFGCRDWIELRKVSDAEERCERAIELLRVRIGGSHHLDVRMLAENGQAKYVLLHAANHPRAFQVMKQSLWSVVPEGDFRVRQSDDPSQGVLLTANPDLRPLESAIWNAFDGKRVPKSEYQRFVDEQTYFLPSHATELLRKWLDSGFCQRVDGKRSVPRNADEPIAFSTRPPSLRRRAEF